MTASRNPNFTHPTLQNVQDFMADNLMVLMNCHHLATVQNFYPTDQTADVTIDYQKVNFVFNEQTGLYSVSTSPYPAISKAPVIYPHALAGGTTFPLQKGDRCLVLFNDRDMDAWYMGAVNQPPASGRLHSFCDALVLPLGNPSTPIQAFDTARPMLRDGAGTAYVAVNPANGKIQVKNPGQNLATILQSILTHVQSLATAAAAITVPVTTAPGTSGTPLNAATFTSLATQLSTDATNLQGLLE